MTTAHDTARPGPDEPIPYTLTPRGYAALAGIPRPAGAADYVIPTCPGDDPGADWQEMGWDSHANAALAHVAWCPNHPGYWTNGPAVMWETFLQQLDPGEPVPLTLTPKAHAALAAGALPLVDDPGPVDQWACEVCGAGWFGTRPDDGRCRGCLDAL